MYRVEGEKREDKKQGEVGEGGLQDRNQEDEKQCKFGKGASKDANE